MFRLLSSLTYCQDEERYGTCAATRRDDERSGNGYGGYRSQVTGSAPEQTVY